MFFSKKDFVELQEKYADLAQQLEASRKKNNELEKTRNNLLEKMNSFQTDNRELCRQNSILRSVLFEERGKYTKLEAEKNAELEGLQLDLESCNGLLERLNAELSSLHKSNTDLLARLNYQELQKAEKTSKQFGVDYSAESITKMVETFFVDYPIDACRKFVTALQTYINAQEHKKQCEIEERRKRESLLESIINLCKVISNGTKVEHPLVSLLRECGSDVSLIDQTINQVKVSEIAKHIAVRIQIQQTTREMGICRPFSHTPYDYHQENNECLFLISSCRMNGISGVQIIGKTADPIDRMVVPQYIKGKPVLRIISDAFKSQDFSEVILPPSLLEIGNNAFSGCVNLREVILPPSLLKIGENCFNGCIKLEWIDLPNGLQELGQFSFSNCATLSSMFFPSSLTKIPRYCCSNCGKLKNVVIEDGIQEIGMRAFSSCPISKIALPKSVTQMHERTFENNDWMHIAFCNPNFSIIRDGYVLGGRHSIYYLPEGSNLEIYARSHKLEIQPLSCFN